MLGPAVSVPAPAVPLPGEPAPLGVSASGGLAAAAGDSVWAGWSAAGEVRGADGADGSGAGVGLAGVCGVSGASGVVGVGLGVVGPEPAGGGGLGVAAGPGVASAAAAVPAAAVLAPAPDEPTPDVPAFGVPAFGVPAFGVPASAVPAPGVPAPGVPAPALEVPTPGVPALGVPAPAVPAFGVPAPDVLAPGVAAFGWVGVKVRTERPMWIWSWGLRGVGAVRRRPLRPVPLREASWRVQVAPSRVRRAWMREIWSSAGRRTSALEARPMVISSAVEGRGQCCVPRDSANSVSTNTPPGSQLRWRDSACLTRARSRGLALMRFPTLTEDGGHAQVAAVPRPLSSVINQVSYGVRRCSGRCRRYRRCRRGSGGRSGGRRSAAPVAPSSWGATIPGCSSSSRSW